MEYERQDVKTRILLAAKKLFAKNGYDGTTIRQICEAADSNIALVSYHFGGKENVFLALFEMFSPANRLKAIDVHDDPVKGLHTVVEAMITYRGQNPEMVSIIQQEIFLNSVRLKKITEFTFPVWTKLREILEEGRRRELFEFNSADKTMVMVMALIAFPMKNPNLLSLMTEGEMKTEEIISDTFNFILRGLHYKGSCNQ